MLGIGVGPVEGAAEAGAAAPEDAGWPLGFADGMLWP